jgi:putative flippase GtrA
MKALFRRWLRFNFVGVLGMAVQLFALALFNRLLHGRYLIASSAAIEFTLIHNFLWHRRYTWRDRRSTGPALPQFLRFQLSNGTISLLGNLALMRLLVSHAHLRPLAANAMAIACCSILNFTLGDLWAFAHEDTAGNVPGPPAPSPPAPSPLMSSP